MSEFLTCVESVFEERVKNYWLPFGKPVKTELLYREPQRAMQRSYFKPRSLFCLDLWESNKYGTTKWRLIAARTLSPGEDGQTLPNATPAVSVLLDVKGKERSRAALKWLNGLSGQQDVTELPDAKFELAHLRFNSMTMKEVRQYVKG